MEITVNDIDGSAYQNFLDYLRSPKTSEFYKMYLKVFLDIIPREIFIKHLNEEPADNIEEKASQFVNLAKINTPITKQIIKAYVRELKAKVDAKEYKPSIIKNRLKPIKALLASNDIDFSWKLIDKGLPKAGKTQDRAYTKNELQTMLTKSVDLVDKVIITLFSACGFRIEAWDYFTWNDVVIFYHENGTPKGMALKVYAGDAEEYWTHGTPEAAKVLLLYRENWKSRFGKYPEKSEPLVVATKVIYPKRLRYGGVRSRILKLIRSAGIRPILENSNERHEVPLDHGFRKYNNTMLRRAKVEYADKEEMQGRNLGQESSYGRYVEADFERWPEYQKAIPFLTIDDAEIKEVENQKLKAEKNELRLKVTENEELKEQIKIEREARIKSEMETKQALAQIRQMLLDQHKKENSE